MKNNNSCICEEVSFAITYSAIEEVLMADSSYIARSLYDVAAEKSSVLPIIITADDREFILSRVLQACNHIATNLVAYIAHDTQFAHEPYTFVLHLPVQRNVAIDALISHELLRAIVAYVLAGWYELRLPDMASRQWQLYEAAIAMIRHDVFMAQGRVRRACNYV